MRDEDGGDDLKSSVDGRAMDAGDVERADREGADDPHGSDGSDGSDAFFTGLEPAAPPSSSIGAVTRRLRRSMRT